MKPIRRLALLGMVVFITAPSCIATPEDAGSAPVEEDDDGDRALTVLAAASLTGVFESLAESFSDLHPNGTVKLSFESSSALVAQVQQGVQADVIATADEETMGVLQSDGLLAGPPVVFALNSLAIIVEPGNPRNVQELADLANPELKVVLAAEEVPAGGYARRALDAAGVEVQPVSLEEDVKAVVSKVSLGEADAGIVYVTDARAAVGDVANVPIPPEHNVVARYPIAVIAEAPNERLAEDFVALVRSGDGHEALREAGFSLP